MNSLRLVFLLVLVPWVGWSRNWQSDGGVRVLMSSGGARVDLLALKPTGSREYLAGFENTGSSLDGRVLHLKHKGPENDGVFSRDIDGREKIYLSQKGHGVFFVHHPGSSQETRVFWNQKLSSVAKSDRLLNTFLFRRPEGSVLEKAEVEGRLKSSLDSLFSRCGKRFQYKVDWAEFDPGFFREFDLGRACEVPMKTAEELCVDSIGKEEVQAKIAIFVCKPSRTKSGLSFSGNQLVWAVAPATPDLEEMSRGFLEKNL